MDSDKLQSLGMLVGRKFLADYDNLTTSDLQGCIEAELVKHDLTTAELLAASEIALQYIYEKVKRG